MTKLREQLQAARRAYEAAGYPGDLAADLLPARGRPWVFPFLVAGAAAAAAVVVAFRADPARSPQPLIVDLSQPSAPRDHPRPTPIVYQWPDQMPLTLPAAPLMPTTPPVNVRLTALNDLRPYEDLGPMLRQHLSWPQFAPGPAAPKPASPEPNPTTQQAV